MATLFPRAWKVQVDTLDVSAIDLEFKISATLKPEPNKCVLTLWNVNPDHRAQLLKRNKPNPTGKLVGVPVQVEAGYKDNLSTLFGGDLREVASDRFGVDWKTVLSGDDGGRSYREARFPGGGLSFRKGAPIGNIISQCCDALDIGTGNAADFEATAKIAGFGSTLPGPMVFDGHVATGLTRLLASVSLTWSVQKGALQIREKGKPLNLDAILLSPSTGLLGSPEAAIDASVSLGNPQQLAAGAKVATKKPKQNDPSILKLKTMLIPGLVPGRKINLQSASFSGGYYLSEIEYVGQSWGNEWGCNCVARIY
jgi:hypothetical protein